MNSEEKSSLSLIADYSSSNDSEDEVCASRVSTKRTQHFDERISKVAKRLPVPSIISSLAINTKNVEVSEDGRVRSFPHERGNWATYIFIHYPLNEHIDALVNTVIEICQPIAKIKMVDNFHISLTKTVTLKHHWIELFVSSVRQSIAKSKIQKFLVLLGNVKIYCNEEKTRTFVGLQIRSGFDSLKEAVRIFDNCLQEFKLPQFYEDPSFHMSIAWCAGDKEAELNKKIKNLNNVVDDFLENSEEASYITVETFMCKIGNKIYSINVN